MTYHKRLLQISFLAITACALYACSQKEEVSTTIPEQEIDDTYSVSTEKMTIVVDTLHTGLENPWGMTWLADGTLLVTEKKGEILVFREDEFTGEKIQGLPEVRTIGQGGLLDIQAHPNYGENGWLYISYAKKITEEEGTTTIMRFRLDGNNAVDQEELIMSQPAWKGGNHFGSRIVFDNDGYLFYSSGDRFDTPGNAQDLTNSHGKIHRIHDDGKIPTDNPFVDTPGAVTSIWAYGNRNPQGLYFDNANNRLWESEHGPKGGDELNLIEKGNNYGWPEISYGINYDGSVLTEFTEKDGMEQPATYYVPSIATAGITMVTSDRYPAWKGDILIGALAKTHINRIDIDGTEALSQEIMLQDIGRVRQVKESPDGYLYAITEGTGLLVKILPVN